MTKTIPVEQIVAYGNSLLANPMTTAEERQGVAHMIEFVLNTTDNYKGFRYLSEEMVEEGVKPGVRHLDETDPSSWFKDTDPTRRWYHGGGLWRKFER